jgi:hypothetical protein
MRRTLLILSLLTVACQSTREKNALIVKDRIEKLSSLSQWKPIKCQIKTELAAPQAQKYELAFPDEKELIENWDVSYDWTARHARCEVHPKPLTPVTANQRAFIEEAFCTLMQVFWVHSPFDDLKVLPTDIEDEETKVFLRQKEDTDLGLYLDKTNMSIETKTARKGTYSASYAPVGTKWLPSELKHETLTFKFVLKEFDWGDGENRAPPKSFWIYVGEQAAPSAHTQVQISDCQPY